MKFKRTYNLSENHQRNLPKNMEKPVPPADFANLPDLRRGSESIKYNFLTFEYNHFPQGLLRIIAAKFALAFAILAGLGVLLFSGMTILQAVLAPLPGIMVNAIYSLVMCLVLVLLGMNFFKIVKFISKLVAGRIGS